VIAFEPAICNCLCSGLAPETCAAQTVIEAFVSLDCTGPPASTFGVGAGCNTGAAAASAKSIQVVPPDPAGSGCTVVVDEALIPAIEIEEVAACAADEAAPACPGGSCFRLLRRICGRVKAAQRVRSLAG
jgi:hypothetical protein